MIVPMEVSPCAGDDPIVLSHIMPTPLRLIFGGIGLLGTVLLLVELGQRFGRQPF